jgi:hypothetical protein
MKIYIIIKNKTNIKKPDDIKLWMVYGIYYKRDKSFWECKIANNKNKENKYIIKEIDLNKDIIRNTYIQYNNNSIIDNNKERYNIKSY